MTQSDPWLRSTDQTKILFLYDSVNKVSETRRVFRKMSHLGGEFWWWGEFCEDTLFSPPPIRYYLAWSSSGWSLFYDILLSMRLIVGKITGKNRWVGLEAADLGRTIFENRKSTWNPKLTGDRLVSNLYKVCTYLLSISTSYLTCFEMFGRIGGTESHDFELGGLRWWLFENSRRLFFELVSLGRSHHVSFLAL